LKAKRFGVAALKAARWPSEIGAMKLASSPAVGALAAQQVDGVVLQIVRAGAGALVGVGDGAAVLQPPFAGGGDRAVDPARARGGRGHDAGVQGIEVVRHLDHAGDALAPVLGPLVGDVFKTCDLALVVRDGPVRLDVRPVERAVAAARRRVDQGAVVVVDREPAQLLHGRLGRVGDGGSRRGAKAGLAEAGGQEVVVDAVIIGFHDADVRPFGRDVVLRRGGRAGHGQDVRRGRQARHGKMR
jgi:hypothetical protein